MRFIIEQDYDMQIKQEVVRMLTGDDFYNSHKLIRAEQTAIRQIRNRLGKRYNCDAIFSAKGDERDHWMVTITIDIALYHLYSQTNMRDIPRHRIERYQDAIDWLKDVGNGNTVADLPAHHADTAVQYAETIIYSQPQENHRW